MTTSTTSDVLVIGGGIAGVSLAYRLAADRTVRLIEREPTLAYHTTGRSAALYLESFGNAPIRALTVASKPFLTDPPEGFDRPILTRRGSIDIAGLGRGDAVRALYEDTRVLNESATLITPEQAGDLIPFLRADRVEAAMYDPDAADIDVHALHQGFVRGAKAAGAVIETGFGVVDLSHSGDLWTATDGNGNRRSAPVVVDAAGAWADVIGDLAGATTIGLMPLRRTAFMLPAPTGLDLRDIPTVSDVDETFYVKPETAQLLCSPADETPSEPVDAKPEDLDIAKALEAIGEYTTLDTRRVLTPWAGLRSFVADRTPVIGYDENADGFFWCAGQGGYGIQTCAALSDVAAALVRGDALPDYVTDKGLDAAALSPQRSLP
ncbi:FAD-dependent oxidoreductase [Gordonia jinhuaensis]|uniref:FAD-dependent catabolic D-arginine dehydrogenase DauA n=1 Tax=Gordonia jinhuaensis TaxID=1517702 RepID=A0A916WTP8_9ACTN|nr:FAD-binding oxidoreductase [Gordonia jinhuaensis]GGB28871.1 FAD-dependent catabolic D-arginine dehydrogenase DauA [Gordonia jinhuaensis]